MTETEPTYGYDEQGVLAHFQWREVEDAAETKLQGHPVFRMDAFAKIVLPGDSKTIVVEPLNDGHKKRWPKLWRAFEANQTGRVQGTPIQELTVLNRAQVATLRAAGIESVETLANLPDSRLSMAITRQMRERAQQALKSAPEVEQQLRRDLDDAQRQLKNAMIRIDQLEGALAATASDEQAPPKRKPGRPRKAA